MIFFPLLLFFFFFFCARQYTLYFYVLLLLIKKNIIIFFFLIKIFVVSHAREPLFSSARIDIQYVHARARYICMPSFAKKQAHTRGEIKGVRWPCQNIERERLYNARWLKGLCGWVGGERQSWRIPADTMGSQYITSLIPHAEKYIA